MDKESAKLRVRELTGQLEKYSYSYYVLDNPEITDYEFDMLMQELKALEEQYPELVSPQSPTQRVGGIALNTFEKVEHQVQLKALIN